MKVDRQNAYLLGLGALLFTSVIFLSQTGENRLDIYLSLFTVEYIAFDLIMRPPRRSRWDWVGASLFGIWIFSIILIFI